MAKVVTSFVRRFVMVATFGMLIAFTVMISSAYIFILKLAADEPDHSSQLKSLVLPSKLPPITVEDVVESDLEIYVQFQPKGDQNASFELRPFRLFMLPNGREGLEAVPSTMQQNLLGGTASNSSDSRALEKILAQVVQNVTSKLTTNARWAENSTRINAARWHNFKKKWGNSKTFVLTSSGAVFLASCVQFMSGVAVIINGTKPDPKKFRGLASRWILLNAMVCLVLMTCLSVNEALESDPEKSLGKPDYVSETEGPHITRENSWNEVVVRNMYHLILALDIVGILLLILISAFLINAQK